MFNRCFLTLVGLLGSLVCGTRNIHAQDEPNFEQGFKPFGSFQAGNIDSVNLLNGKVNLHIPIISYPQRGGKLHMGFCFTYGGPTILAENTDCGFGSGSCFFYSGTLWGVQLGDDFNFSLQRNCIAPAYPNTVTGEDGSTHLIDGSSSLTWDGTAYEASPNPSSSYPPCTYNNASSYTDSVTNREGIKHTFGSNGVSTFSWFEDPNGNQITQLHACPAGYVGTCFTDTMNRTISGSLNGTLTDSTGCQGTLPTASAAVINTPGVGSGALAIKICYAVAHYDLTSLCNQNSKCQYADGGGNNVIQSIILSDGSSWATGSAWVFQYDTANYDDLIKITFPTGGSISYTWQNNYVKCNTAGWGYLSFSRSVTTRSLDANDGKGPQTTTYTYSTPAYPTLATTVQDPAGNQAVHTFNPFNVVSGEVPACMPYYETSAKQYQGTATTGTLLQTVTTNYVGAVLSGSAVLEGPGALVSSVTTTLANGQTKQVQMDYEYPVLDASQYPMSDGNVINKREYDFGNGAPGALLRTTSTAYLAASNTNYKNNNLWNVVSSVTVKNGAGTQQAYTGYNYDEYGLVASSVTTQHDSAPPDGSYRGNQTSVHSWLNDSTTSTTNCPISITNGYLISYSVYNDTGTVDHSVDSCGSSASDTHHKTSYSYSTTATCSQNFLGAFPTVVTNALGQSTNYCYDFNTGLTTSVTDPNGQATSYSYDNMLRMTQTTYPPQTVNGVQLNGMTTFTYPAATQVRISELMDNNSRYRVSNLLVDGVGREIRRNTTNGESIPYDQIDTCYNNVGLVGYKSYPYQSTGISAPISCPGTAGDSFTYDALGRTTRVTHSDGTSASTTYIDSSNHTGRAALFSDEGNGSLSVQRISQVDGLGRLAKVCELTSTTLTSGISGSTTPASCGLDIGGTGFLTSYSYDTLDDLVSVSQWPLNSRTFVYDSLSRLAQATNPETSSICYGALVSGACQWNGYDGNGNLIKKTDPRGIVITNTYDYLNRLTGKTYSDTTPAVTFNYDQTSAMGVTLTNTISRRSSMSTAATSSNIPTGSVFSYDSMGRVLNNSQCTPQNCSGTLFPITYTYDLIGDVLSSTNGFGLTLTNTMNIGGRLTSVSNSATAFGAAGTLFSGAHFNAAGSLLSGALGSGINETRCYDGRLRLASISVGTVYSLTVPSGPNYCGQTQGGGYAPDGDILAATDSVNGNWTYGYDAFNRLTSASATGQAYTYTYDRFGNRWQQNGPHSSQLGFDANNHIVPGGGVTYDAAGNTINDGTIAYTYDAEGRVSTAGGSSTYVYDADGRRVRKTTAANGTVDFVYDIDGHEIAQVSSAGTWTRGEIYAGGRHLAIFSNNTTYYDHTDWLGTERARSSSTGALYETCTSLPFGDWLACVGSIDPSPMHFTGKERDSESGLDNFGARYDSSQYGRFMTPDPMGNYFANPAFPQSWNLYSYVQNNPLNLIDPNGLDCVYLNDAGNGVDDNGIDHNSNQGECWNNGGYWANGTVTDASSVVTHSNSDNIDIFSTDGNGNSGWTNAGVGYSQNPGHLDVTFVSSSVPPGRNTNTTPPTNKDYIRAIANGIPAVCGGGVLAYGGVGGEAFGVSGFKGKIAEYDSSSGFSTGTLTEYGATGIGQGQQQSAGYGRVSSGGGKETLGFYEMGEIPGVASGGILATHSAVGVYAEGEAGPIEGGVGAYANITSAANCHR